MTEKKMCHICVKYLSYCSVNSPFVFLLLSPYLSDHLKLAWIAVNRSDSFLIRSFTHCSTIVLHSAISTVVSSIFAVFASTSVCVLDIFLSVEIFHIADLIVASGLEKLSS